MNNNNIDLGIILQSPNYILLYLLYTYLLALTLTVHSMSFKCRYGYKSMDFQI